MFLPARMTRVLLGGHKARMAEAIDLLHAQGLVHLEDFRDDSGSTDIGTPLDAGDEVSAHLVRLRGMQKALEAEGMTGKAMPASDAQELLDEADQATRPALEELAEIRSQLSSRQAELSQLAPYENLQFDMAALNGLDSITAFVGTAREAPAIKGSCEVTAAPYGSGVALALFVRNKHAEGAEVQLQKVGFQPANLPAGLEGTPRQRLAALRNSEKEIQAHLTAAEARVAALRETWGPKLAALEKSLASEVSKTQAPLQFGVTEQTFHVEGWIPAGKYSHLEQMIHERFEGNMYLENLGDAPIGHDDHGDGHGHDDHHDVSADDEAPIHLDNPKIAKPYEFLLSLLGRPRYNEIDPTKLMLIFFPLFFGLMVGDLVVGLLIALLGIWLKKNHLFGIGGPAVGRSLFAGGILAMIVGAFIFGEALGIHFVVDPHALEEGELSWEALIYGTEAVMHGEAGFPEEGFIHKTGHAAPAGGHGAAAHAAGEVALHAAETSEHKGGLAGMLTPHQENHLSLGGFVNLGYYSKIHDIQALLIWSVMIAFVHLNLAFLIGIRNVAVGHGVTLAIQEKLSWITAQIGIGVALWGAMLGGPTWATAVGVGIFVVSIGLLWKGVEKALGAPGFVAILEFLGFFGNVLSYTRLAAIGASKAGIVVAVIAVANLVAGAPTGGLAVVWWIIYLIGIVAVTLLATLSGGLQSLRLQFVEFFQKFYTGGGRAYLPFGRRS